MQMNQQVQSVKLRIVQFDAKVMLLRMNGIFPFSPRPSFLYRQDVKKGENLIMNTLEHSLNYFSSTMQE